MRRPFYHFRHIKFALIISLTLLGSVSAPAQIEVPLFTKHALLNGLEFFFLPADKETGHFSLMIRNGAAFDPADKPGLTSIMVRMMLERTERRTAQQVSQDLEIMGARVEARVEMDAIFFFGSAPQNRMKDVLNILAEIVLQPSLEEENLETVKSALLGELEKESQSVSWLTQGELLAAVFQENPYSHFPRGTVAGVQAVQLNDVKIQYRKLFMPNQAQIALTYAGDTAELFNAMGRPWGRWIRGKPAPFTFRPAERQPIHLRVLNREEGPAMLRIGALAAEQGSRAYYSLKILEHYLTLSLPDLAQQIEQAGQIQGSVEFQSGRMPGIFQVNIQTRPEYVSAYLGRLTEATTQIGRGEIEPTRFKEAKEMAFLDLRRRLESAPGRVFALQQAHLYDLGLNHFRAFGLRLDRVGADQFSEDVLAHFDPKKWAVVAAGPASVLSPALAPFGSVDILN